MTMIDTIAYYVQYYWNELLILFGFRLSEAEKEQKRLSFRQKYQLKLVAKMGKKISLRILGQKLEIPYPRSVVGKLETRRVINSIGFNYKLLPNPAHVVILG